MGVPYVGAGNSTNKKDAEKNAARDFVNFLIRTGQINASEVPASAIEQGGALPARATPQETVPVFQVCIYHVNLVFGDVETYPKMKCLSVRTRARRCWPSI